MTTQTIGSAIAKRDEVKAVLEEHRPDFAQLLPEHLKAKRWLAGVNGALLRDDKLADAAHTSPGSLIVALLDAASKGLEPGSEQYYLTVRKKKGVPQVLGITGYQGEIEMIYRAGAVSSVVVEVVRTKDSFRYRPGRDPQPIHDIDWDADDRGELKYAYAYAWMKDGAISKVVVLGKAHIAKAKAKAEGAGSDWSPWKTDEEPMWMKTAVHRLAKFVPTSAEYKREQLRAIAEVGAETAGSPTGKAASRVTAAAVSADDLDDEDFDDDTVYDGELVDGEEERDPIEDLWRQIRAAVPAKVSMDEIEARFATIRGYAASNATEEDLRNYLALVKKESAGGGGS